MKVTHYNTKNLISDEEIIGRITKGEKHLYENLIRKYNARLFRIAMSIINDDVEAEDIMQTAYINAYLQLSAFNQKSSFGTWLTRILINESLLHKKRKERFAQVLMQKQSTE